MAENLLTLGDYQRLPPRMRRVSRMPKDGKSVNYWPTYLTHTGEPWTRCYLHARIGRTNSRGRRWLKRHPVAA